MASNKSEVLRKKIKKVKSLRARTKLAEEAGEKILRPLIPENIAIEELQYKDDEDSYHACDFIFQRENSENIDEISKNSCKNHENTTKKPLMIYVHGGGWTVGSKDARRCMLAQFARRGYFVISMNYTLFPEAVQFTQVKEIFDCVEFAFSKNEEYNFNPSQVFLCGDSAGGHLVALASVYQNNEYLKSLVGYNFKNQFEISAICPICGVFDFRTVLSCRFFCMKKFLWAYSGGNRKAFLKDERSYLESPMNFPSDFPPCYIVMGEGDRLKTQSEQLLLALAEVGGDFKLYIGKGKKAFHVFPIMCSSKMAQDCISGICDFFDSKRI